jgi:hypothetical protein
MKRIINFLKQLFSCPVGYQDETGFHYGEEPRDKV